jgi:hypothetical protein
MAELLVLHVINAILIVIAKYTFMIKKWSPHLEIQAASFNQFR